MKALLIFGIMSALLLGQTFPAWTQDQPPDPFGGGFSMNHSAEIFTMGAQDDSLHGWGFDWISDLDSILMIGTGSFPESFNCGDLRDIAAADFNGNYMDELVLVWNRSDGGVFVGIPTIDMVTLEPDPTGWHVPDVPIAPGVLYATDSLADILGEIRVVAGNFYDDHAMEFVLAYLAADSTVTLSVFDVDTATSIPVEMASISDQAVNTEVEATQRADKISRFDVTTGDFDGDGFDEIVLIANDPAQSPAADVMVDVYDYDTLGHVIDPVSKITFTVNDSLDHTCLRRLAVTAGNFDTDCSEEIALMHRWADPLEDTSRIGTIHILELNPEMSGIDYIQDDALPPAPRWTAGNAVYAECLTVYDNELIAGGQFTSAGGTAANRIAAWDGSTWDSLSSGMNAVVFALNVYDNKLIAGGLFTTAGGTAANYIAAWDGSSWSPLGSGMSGIVHALTVYDNKLIAGGEFLTAGGTSVHYIAAWDGSSWSPLGSGMSSTVVALTVYDNKLIAGGYFTTAGGTTANYIAAWDGSSWSPLGTGMNEYVEALTVYDNKLIAGGAFLTAGGTAANYITAWDGLSWSLLGSGMNSAVEALTVYDNKLIAGGYFTTAGGTTANYIAAWDGSSWAPLGSGMNSLVFDFTLYDNKLIAEGWFTIAGGTAVLWMAAWDGSKWDGIGLNRGLPMDLIAGNSDRNAPGVSIVTDNLFVTGCRENAGKIEQYIKAYAFDTSSVPAALCLRYDTTVIDSIGLRWPPGDFCTSRRTMALADVTGEGYADLTMLVWDNTYWDTTRIVLLELYPDTGLVCAMDSVITKGAWATDSYNFSELVLADLDTATVTIGRPKIYHVDSVVQPLAIINAPPVHYDILDDTTWDVSNRYPLPPNPDYDTYVEYYNSTGFVITTETEMHRDWGVSVGLETWASAGGFDVSAYLETAYGEGFSQYGGYSEQITVGATITARDDDQLHAVRVSYDILEYPVLRAGELMGHVVVASPSETSEGWSPGEGYRSFVPDHEVDNILSYPRPEDIENNPMMASDVIGDANDYYTMQAATTNQWYLGHQVFTQSSVTESWDASVAAGGSFGYEGGFSIFGIGFSAGFEVSLDAEYAVGQLSTFSTSFSETDSLHVQMGYINSAGSESGNRTYEITPYAYWAKNGALVIDYAAKAIVNPQGELPTWWQIHYSEPDPAFLLSRRLDNEKYGVNDPEESRYRTKEIVFIPSYPAPGDTVLISARVHNFSLVPTPDPVAVSFYLGNPGNWGVILTDKNSGDSIFYACDTSGAPIPIEAQRDAIAEMVWQVPDVGSISGCQRIWAVIDPLDSISPEVHDNNDWATNNKGWKLLYVNTPDICIDTDGDDWADPAFRCNTCPHEFDNCPTVYNPDQTDTDGDGIGDACEEVVYVCGDANNEGNTNILDITYLIAFLYKGGPAPEPDECVGDVNGTDTVNILDITYLIAFLYKDGPPPVEDCCDPVW